MNEPHDDPDSEWQRLGRIAITPNPLLPVVSGRIQYRPSALVGRAFTADGRGEVTLYDERWERIGKIALPIRTQEGVRCALDACLRLLTRRQHPGHATTRVERHIVLLDRVRGFTRGRCG